MSGKNKKLTASSHTWLSGRLWLRLSLKKTNHRKSCNPSSADQENCIFEIFLISVLSSLFLLWYSPIWFQRHWRKRRKEQLSSLKYFSDVLYLGFFIDYSDFQGASLLLTLCIFSLLTALTLHRTLCLVVSDPAPSLWGEIPSCASAPLKTTPNQKGNLCSVGKFWICQGFSFKRKKYFFSTSTLDIQN